MKYDFDEIIDRKNTASVKYDLRKMFFGTEEVIPMWVADMDFKTPPFILEAIKKRAEHPVLGYSVRPDSYYSSIQSWLSRRHSWNIKREWICFSPGIVPALNMVVLAYTNPGDKIIVQPPVYFPFFGAITGNKRKLLYNPLKMNNGRYRMDFQNLEQQCKKGASMILISNPHNPGGNAWTSDELKELARICLKYNVLMVSDEIHCDLVNIGYKHCILASLGRDVATRTITMMAPSKTFNLAALSTASVIISNAKLRKRYNDYIQGLHIDMGNVFGTIASIAAYEQGDVWLDQLLKYINQNINFLQSYLEQNIPEIKMIRPEATYMVWLDCSKLSTDPKVLNEFMIRKAGLGLNPGIQFGTGGELYMRINIACPLATLKKAVSQLKKAVKEFHSNSPMNTV